MMTSDISNLAFTTLVSFVVFTTALFAATI